MSPRLFIILLIALAYGVLALPSLSLAQVTITTNQNLVFGNVLPGITKVIDKSDPTNAAEIHIDGPAGAEVTIDFSLPMVIKQSTYPLILSFSDTDCAMDSSVNQLTNQSTPGHTDLDPKQQIIYGLGANGLTIWLGGSALPSTTQITGDYSGTIYITVDTTGG